MMKRQEDALKKQNSPKTVTKTEMKYQLKKNVRDYLMNKDLNYKFINVVPIAFAGKRELQGKWRLKGDFLQVNVRGEEKILRNNFQGEDCKEYSLLFKSSSNVKGFPKQEKISKSYKNNQLQLQELSRLKQGVWTPASIVGYERETEVLYILSDDEQVYEIPKHYYNLIKGATDTEHLFCCYSPNMKSYSLLGLDLKSKFSFHTELLNNNSISTPGFSRYLQRGNM